MTLAGLGLAAACGGIPLLCGSFILNGRPARLKRTSAIFEVHLTKQWQRNIWRALRARDVESYYGIDYNSL